MITSGAFCIRERNLSSLRSNASSARLRSVTSCTVPENFAGRPDSSWDTSYWVWTKRTSPSGRTMRYSTSSGLLPCRTPRIAPRTRSLSSGWTKSMKVLYDGAIARGAKPKIRYISSDQCVRPPLNSCSQFPMWAIRCAWARLLSLRLSDSSVRLRSVTSRTMLRIARWPPYSVTDELMETCIRVPSARDRKSTRLNSSHANISYAAFCLPNTDEQSSRGEEELHLEHPEFVA